MKIESANAKLNLYLAVTGRRDDGYHELEMVNISVTLADSVSLSYEPAGMNIATKPDIDLEISGSLTDDELDTIPTDERNLAVKALLLASRTCPFSSARCHIEKNIPAGGGLAGGSSDAAAVLRLLDLSRETALEYALALGADVPFCYQRSPAVVTGIGERITPFSLNKTVHFVVINPGIFISTKEMFHEIDANPLPPNALLGGRPEILIALLQRGDFSQLQTQLRNDLEAVAERKYPHIGELRSNLISAGAIAAMMTGSGSSVFGIFDSGRSANEAASRLRSVAPYVRYCSSFR